jgi:hypothetical protein
MGAYVRYQHKILKSVFPHSRVLYVCHRGRDEDTGTTVMAGAKTNNNHYITLQLKKLGKIIAT